MKAIVKAYYEHLWTMAILIVTLLFNRIWPTWHWLELAHYLLASWVFLIGFTLITSSLSAVYRDFFEFLNPAIRTEINLKNVYFIAPDGSVLYDSDADEARMDSHAQRPEVLAALADGTGEATRYSDTISEVTIYYARRTADGNVLRIASTRSSALGVFLSVAPQIVISLLMVAVRKNDYAEAEKTLDIEHFVIGRISSGHELVWKGSDKDYTGYSHF